ncbi:MAG TPA: sigma-70 family RNA polymerase sigma factor [Firmicutes bacterium]|nr:sigma-70 family RNA polymerase sigma factor [Candidatus Fermentithermobacillaceae bacterium]
MEENPLQQGGLDPRFLAWIATGMRREAIRLSKRNRRRYQHELLILDRPLTNPDNPSEYYGSMADLIPAPDDTQQEVEDRLLTDSALRTLTESQRTAVIGVIMRGHTERTIAQSMGISQSMVNKLKHAGLRRLKFHLEEGGDSACLQKPCSQ